MAYAFSYNNDNDIIIVNIVVNDSGGDAIKHGDILSRIARRGVGVIRRLVDRQAARRMMGISWRA